MKLLLLLFTLFFNLLAYGNQLRIGCAYTCDGFTIEALLQSARRHSSELVLFDLTQQKKVPWEKLDALIIPGGADVDPKYYLRHVEPTLQEQIRKLDHLVEYTEEGKIRDEFEYSLLREYYSSPGLRDFPVLGLCRGMQIMGVALGIPLYVDLRAELGIPNRIDLYDRIVVTNRDSWMSQLFPEEKFRAYKSHHQGLRVPYFQQNAQRWSNVQLTAFSHSGKIAEALELKDRPALGVQFHPEVDDDKIRRKIFDWIISRAKKRAEARQ